MFRFNLAFKNIYDFIPFPNFTRKKQHSMVVKYIGFKARQTQYLFYI